jgi:hypothetical protein
MQLRATAVTAVPDQEVTAPLPGWLCAVLGAQLALLLPLGLALFLTPTRADAAWPWALTPLTGRALGAWLLGWSVVLAQALWERAWRRVRVSLASFGLWGALALLAVARYSSALDWSAGRSWVWLGVAGSSVGVGAYSVVAGWGLARGGRLARTNGTGWRDHEAQRAQPGVPLHHALARARGHRRGGRRAG